MSNTQAHIDAYIARQPAYAWRRAFMRGLIRTIGFHVLAKPTITGTEHIPRSGPTILMMSHVSLIDPVVCLGAVTERFAIPMTKIENARNPIFGVLVWGWGAYTVDRDTVDRSSLMNSIALLKAGHMILIAPEGTRSPDGLRQPKDGMTYVATKADAMILPAAMSGGTDYLDRWKRLRRVHTRVDFGQPFKFKTAGRKHIPRDELALMTQEAMYQLAIAQSTPELRGEYSDLSLATTNTIEFVAP